jgi:hypothetical protein
MVCLHACVDIPTFTFRLPYRIWIFRAWHDVNQASVPLVYQSLVSPRAYGMSAPQAAIGGFAI